MAGPNYKPGQPKANDPKLKRMSCTNVLCILMLIAFIIGWCIVALIAFRKGDPSTLVHPVDYLGQRCGQDEPVRDKPYLFFFDVLECITPSIAVYGCETPQVCIEKCPYREDWTPWFVRNALINGESETSIKEGLVCKYFVDKNLHTVEELIDPNSELCAQYYFIAYMTVANRCIPVLVESEEFTKTGSTLMRDFLLSNAKKAMGYVFDDLRDSWPWIFCLVGVATIVSFIWICLMGCAPGAMTWLSLFGLVGVLSFCCNFSVKKYTDLWDINETVAGGASLQQLELKNSWMVLAIITGTLLLTVLFLIMLFLRSGLFDAVTLIKQGVRAVNEMTFTLAWSICPWIARFVIIGWFLLVGIYLATASEPVFKAAKDYTCSGTTYIENEMCEPESCPDSICILHQYQTLYYGPWFHAYNFFGFLWLMHFVTDFGDMVLADCFAGWHFTTNRLNRPRKWALFPVSSSLLQTVRYHVGIVAFGSLFISIFEFIRHLVEYTDFLLWDYPMSTISMWFMVCYFWCTGKLIIFINRVVYIMAAVSGRKFIDTFFVLVRNALPALIVATVTNLLLLMGKLIITGGLMITSFLVFTHNTGTRIDHLVPQLNFYPIPVMIVTLATYFITSMISSVYEMAVDVLLLCVLEDSDE